MRFLILCTLICAALGVSFSPAEARTPYYNYKACEYQTYRENFSYQLAYDQLCSRAVQKCITGNVAGPGTPSPFPALSCESYLDPLTQTTAYNCHCCVSCALPPIIIEGPDSIRHR